MISKEVIDLRDKISIMTPKNGVTEEYCIKRFNEALKDGYIDSDADSDGIIYIEINFNEAESLFNDLFENATFNDYLETHCEGADDTSCDIAPMWGLLCKVIGDDVYFNAKNGELYKSVLL